jgi:hypothetical protein
MCGLRSGHLKSIGQEPLCDHLDTDERHDQRGMPLCRCSKLYHCRSGSPGTCCIQILEPGRREFLPVLRGAEQRLAYVLSSLTRGREYDGFTPSQCSIASAVVAFSGALRAVSPCSTGLASRVAMLSASAVRRTKCPSRL